MFMRFEQSAKDTQATFLPANDDLQELWQAENVEKALLRNLQYLEARAEFQPKSLASLFHFSCRYMPLLVALDLC